MILDTLADIPLTLAIPAALVALLVLRRIPVIGPLVNLVTWLLIGIALYMAIDQRSRLDPYLGPVADWLRPQRQEVIGKELRVRMAQDGHFWVMARFGGTEKRLLVDSGATITALSADTASAAGLKPRQDAFPLLIRTANGTINAESATVDEMRIGNIVARDLEVVVSPAFGGANVLGMNFLSRLQSWRVEGRTLILVPHHPQPVAKG